MLSAMDYALARSQQRERSKVAPRPNIEQETFSWIRDILSLLRPLPFSLLPPQDGWTNKELYLTYRPPHCSHLWGRMYLDVNAAGWPQGKNDLRLVLLGESGLIWKFKHVLTAKPYSALLQERANTLDQLGRSWEPCLFHPQAMNLRVNPTNGYVEWYCQICDATASIPAILRSAVRRQTPRKFWQSRKKPPV